MEALHPGGRNYVPGNDSSFLNNNSFLPVIITGSPWQRSVSFNP